MENGLSVQTFDYSQFGLVDDFQSLINTLYNVKAPTLFKYRKYIHSRD